MTASDGIMKRCDGADPLLRRIILICVFCGCSLVKRHHILYVAGNLLNRYSRGEITQQKSSNSDKGYNSVTVNN